MRAVFYEDFNVLPVLKKLPEPEISSDAVLVEVKASGICRSDWHGWAGHDPDIKLPHVPGHEFSGIIAAKGPEVKKWSVGDRVTVPFVGGCGHCPQCDNGNPQVCDHQFQPGFTHWGSFAEFVEIKYADFNLVRLPEWLDFDAAASLGCRFVTAFRAVVDQGRLAKGEYVAVFGCGGVGLSAIQIARVLGAQVIGVDVSHDALTLAANAGAHHLVHAKTDHVVETIQELTGGGVHLSIDAIGRSETILQCINALTKRGRHIQVGLMPPQLGYPSIPMDIVIARELEIRGSHGIQASRYHAIFELLDHAKIDPGMLISRKVNLEESIDVLVGMGSHFYPGITIINQF
jgi:alcohol dehydrogenase